MEQPCVWFYVWTGNRLLEKFYDCAHFRSLAAAKRYAERVLDKYPDLEPKFKFEKVAFLNGLVVKREFIA